MKLSREQRQQLEKALIDAFPNQTYLERMLDNELDKNLIAITGGGSLQDIVFKLIQAADSQGWIINLICAAYNHNVGNSKLDSIVQKLIIKNSPTIYNIIEESLRERGYFELDELGSGAIGVTYRTSIRENDQRVIVIKTIKSDLIFKILKSTNQELKELDNIIINFQKEAEILSSLKHRHIVSYDDYLTIKYNLVIHNPDKNPNNKSYLLRQFNLIFLIMEYIEGETLEQLLSRRDTPLENKEALGYIQQIGQALTHVHNKGVLHRDIKPQNIMVRKTTNDAVLIDFGIAREFNSKVTQTHTVAFTQGYAPPEQLEERSKRGNYTDVYGLAATLYYLLTKKHPIHAMLRKSDSSSFVEPKKINSNISDTVNEAILLGMELESSKRPQTVQEWLEKLPSSSTPIVPTLKSPEVPKKAFRANDFSSGRGVDYTQWGDILQIFKFEVVTVNRRGEITKRNFKTAQYFIKNLGNNAPLEMVAIPGGKFRMGSSAEEVKRFYNESPQHGVIVQPFFMGKYPVTQAQWRNVATLEQVNRGLNPDPSNFKGDNLPVEQISWYEAVEFCDRVSKLTGQNYRLPSEAEWEYACRAGTTTPFHFGETITSNLANYNSEVTYGDEAKGKSVRQVTPVGSFIANAFGLYDVHGNVWEWCYDDWHSNYQSAPDDGRAWINEVGYHSDNENKSRRMLRGGSCDLYPEFCRSAYRNHYEPGSRKNDIGFRVVVSGART